MNHVVVGNEKKYVSLLKWVERTKRCSGGMMQWKRKTVVGVTKEVIKEDCMKIYKEEK